MLTTGVDLIEIARIDRAITRWGERFLRRVYTERELARYRERIPELAARFAAKEAVSKALGTGVANLSNNGVGWTEIETLPDAWGKPLVTLYRRAALRSAQLGLTEWAISLSHAKEFAIAVVVANGSTSY